MDNTSDRSARKVDPEEAINAVARSSRADADQNNTTIYQVPDGGNAAFGMPRDKPQTPILPWNWTATNSIDDSAYKARKQNRR